jgi:hypothetical protein
MTEEEISSGLVLTYVAQAVAGKAGAAAILLTIFMVRIPSFLVTVMDLAFGPKILTCTFRLARPLRQPR